MTDLRDEHDSQTGEIAFLERDCTCIILLSIEKEVV